MTKKREVPVKPCRYLYGNECRYWDGTLTDDETLRCYTPAGWSDGCYEWDDGLAYPPLEELDALDLPEYKLRAATIVYPLEALADPTKCWTCNNPPNLQKEGSWYKCPECGAATDNPRPPFPPIPERSQAQPFRTAETFVAVHLIPLGGDDGKPD